MGWRIITLLCALVVAPASAAEPDPGYDAWRGWLGVASTATGRFRVEQVDGVWWLITPDGHGFFSVGVDHLTPGGDFSPALGRSPYTDNILALYGSEAGWAAVTLARLQDLGFNTVGAFSRPELFAGNLAYTVTLALAANAPEVPGVPPPLLARVTRDYFHPAFAAGVATTVAARVAPCAADPWCIGVFTDNEMGLNQSLAQTLPYLDAYLLLPAGAPGKVAVQDFFAARYAGDLAAFNAAWGLALASFDDVQNLSGLSPAPAVPPAAPVGSAAQQADRRTFDAQVAALFHRVTHDAIRAVAPDVLILGSRLLVLSTRPEVLEAIAPYVDILTLNYYEIAASVLALVPQYPNDYGIPFAKMFDDVDAMYRIAGKPMLIGEFGYRAADSGLPNTWPPLFPTLATQTDRAQAAGTYLRRVLARPYLVGAHWFQYMDQPATGRFDGENQNFGLVKITDEPWPEVTARFRAVNTGAAPRRLLAAGGRGSSRTDCTIEWAATAPLAAPRSGRRPPPARFTCRDGNPACDTDTISGQCTVEIQPCAAVSDARLPACMPTSPATVRVTKPTATEDPGLNAALAASLQTIAASAGAHPGSCGPAVHVVTALGSRTRAHRTVRTSAEGATGRDREAIRIICERAD